MNTEENTRLWTAAHDLYRAHRDGETLIAQTYEGTVTLSYSARTRCYTATATGRTLFHLRRVEARSALAALYTIELAA